MLTLQLVMGDIEFCNLSANSRDPQRIRCLRIDHMTKYYAHFSVHYLERPMADLGQ